MTKWQQFQTCASNVGRALIGRQLPSVEEALERGRVVVETCGEIAGEDIGATLKAIYDEALNEPVPERLAEILDRLTPSLLPAGGRDGGYEWPVSARST